MKEAKINLFKNLIPSTPHSPFVYFDDLWWDNAEIHSINLDDFTLDCTINHEHSYFSITYIPRYIYDQIYFAVQKHFSITSTK